MIDHELYDELNELPEEDREFTECLLKAANVYQALRPKDHEVIKRASEKGITFHDARIELRDEARTLQRKMGESFLKHITPELSKNAREKFGIKSAGRPKGSKKLEVKYSKQVLAFKMSEFINSYFEQEGKEPTQDEAAKALGLGYAKKLYRLLRDYGETRKWTVIVDEVLAKSE